MGKSSPSAPASPNPQAVAQANDTSALYNVGLADANQVGPLGSVTYAQTAGQPTYNTQAYNSALNAWDQQSAQQQAGQNGKGGGANSQNYQNWLQNNPEPQLNQYMTSQGNPQFTATTTLSPQDQQLFNQTMANQNTLAGAAGGLTGQIQSAAQNPINYSSFGAPPAAGDLQNMENTSYNAQMAQMQPSFDRQNEQENAQLLAQGITPGSQAWNNAWQPILAGQGQAEDQATLNAQQYASGMDNTALQNINQQIQEAQMQQSQPINEYSALMGNTQVQLPSFSATPGAGVQVPMAGQELQQNYANEMNQYNAQLASQQNGKNSLFGGLGSVGGAIIDY